MTPLTVLIAGEPIGKGRPRVVRTRSGNVRGVTPQKTREWERYAVRVLVWWWRGRPPLVGPVKVSVKAIKSRPQRLTRKSDPEGLRRKYHLRPSYCQWAPWCQLSCSALTWMPGSRGH